MDDLDSDHFGHLLKIWADRYACSGECKGCTIPLCHTTFVVTSNCSIVKLFEKQPIMIAPLQRRFVEVELSYNSTVLEVQEKID